MTELFQIFAGTYEEYLIGLSVQQEENKYVLEHTVADHSHKASVRSISSSENLLATGGADEIIHLYNVDEKHETGILSQHSGTVTCLSFTSDGKHLLSCGEDGCVIIYRVGSWVVEKIWNKAHKGTTVNWISVHPSNKMAFTVGNDGKLRTWNLMDGTEAYSTNLSKKCKRPEHIVWSPNGTMYCLGFDNQLEIYEVDNASLMNSISMSEKVSSVIFLEGDLICAGDNGGFLECFKVSSGEKLWRHCAGESRVKSICFHENFLVSCSSQGVISVFQWTRTSLELLTSFDTGCRITCATISCKCHRNEKRSKPKLKNHKDKEGKVEDTDKKLQKKKEIKSWSKGNWTVEEFNV